METTAQLASSIITAQDLVWCIEENVGRELWNNLHAQPLAAYQAAHPAPDDPLAAYMADNRRKAHGDLPGVMAHEDDGRKRFALTADGVAVISLSGPMMKSPGWSTGGASTVALRRMLADARMDADVKSALLIIDSPGGAASGTDELAQAVDAFAKAKPITAFVDGMMASAALWVGSQAALVVAARASHVGSIGTVMQIPDLSRMAAMAGVDMHRIRNRHPDSVKGAGMAGLPLSEGDKSYFQNLVDGITGHFLQAVADGRGLDPSAVQAMADGRVHSAADAQALGLIDRIATIPEAYDTLVASTKPSQTANRQSSQKEPRMADNTETVIKNDSPLHRLGVSLGFITDPNAAAPNLAGPVPPPVLPAPPSAFTAGQLAILAACTAAGITAADQVGAMHSDAADGRTLKAGLLAEVNAQAVRAFGADQARAICVGLEHLPTATLIEKRDAYRAHANTKFGITGTDGAARASAGAELPTPEAGADTTPPSGAAAHLGSGTSEDVVKAGVELGRAYGADLNGTASAARTDKVNRSGH